jgi:hypothetical protein
MIKNRRYPEPKPWYPKNKNKYKGDPYKIISRSSWETKVFSWMDTNPNVLEWHSEELFIYYLSPVDSKYHRYFVDIYAKIKISENVVKTYLIEIKPEAQTKPPKLKKNLNKTYINEVCTWGINSSKWQAAEKYCRDRDWEFKILTEKEIFGKK